MRRTAVPAPAAEAPVAAAIDDLVLQDQSGETFTYRDFFHGRASVVTFFYTRCMNPEKCSLTITRLACLQHAISESDLRCRVNLAALTYDPAYDTPRRLQAYGRERGFRFDEHNRLMRTQGPFEPLQISFDLGVGFGPSTVNRHAVELLILEPTGAVARAFRRVQLDEADALQAVRALRSCPSPVRS
jgi:cytochrome oxidase Cu insertion factor (SCO1/SenC/PrrC family)